MNIVYPPSSTPGLDILSCRDGHGFDPHLHEGYVLWLNSEAGEQFSVRGHSDILQPGSISLIEPGVVHSNQPCDPSRRHLRSFYFGSEFLDALAGRMVEGDGLPLLHPGVCRDARLTARLERLHEHLLPQPGGVPPESAEEDVLAVFAELFVRTAGLSVPTEPTAKDWRLHRVETYLRDTLDRPVRLAVLAELAGCTEFHLIRLFRRHKGMSPHAYHLQLRLEHARHLLEQGHPISVAAQMAGMCDQSHLTRAFRRRYGLTPGEYAAQRGSRSKG